MASSGSAADRVKMPPGIFLHTKLWDAASQIRLLKLNEGPESETIVGTLGVFDMSSAPPYAAISYAWGVDRLAD